MQLEKIINYKAHFLKIHDVWASKLVEENIIFFGLTINFDCLFLDNTHENLFSNIEQAQSWVKSFSGFLSEIDFIECFQGALVIKDGILHLESVLGFRSHFNCIQFIQNKIKVLLCGGRVGNYNLYHLKHLKDIIWLLQDFSKDFDKERPYGYHFMAVYSSFFVEVHEYMIDNVIDGGINAINGKTFFDLFECYSDYPSVVPGKFSDILAIPRQLSKNRVYEIIFYLDYFFKIKNFILYNSDIYKKMNLFLSLTLKNIFTLMYYQYYKN